MRKVILQNKAQLRNGTEENCDVPISRQKKGTYMKDYRRKGTEIYVDADFAGEWTPYIAQTTERSLSRHG